MASSFRVTRFYTTADGGSKFDEIEFPIDRTSTDAWGNVLGFSESWDSSHVRIFEVPTGAYQSWHNAPCRQLCVMFQGVWEICTTDGQRRQWRAGEAFLPDTVTGKGHTSRAIEGPVRMVFIPLPETLDIEQWRVN